MDNKPTDIKDPQIPSDDSPAASDTTGGPDKQDVNQDEHVYLAERKDNIDNNDQTESGILDIVYGVLFEPGETFARFAQEPPLVSIVIIFLVLNLAGVLTGFYTTPVYLDRISEWPGIAGPGANQAMLSFVAIFGFLLSAIKWFFMAGLLHLLAELYGGTGTAKSVWAVYGAAGLPVLFMLPLQIGAGLFNTGMWYDFITGLLTLGLYIWCVVLLVIGLREVHHITTGRAVLVVITPWLMLAFLLLVSLIFIGIAASSFIMQGF